MALGLGRTLNEYDRQVAPLGDVDAPRSTTGGGLSEVVADAGGIKHIDTRTAARTPVLLSQLIMRSSCVETLDSIGGL